MPAGRTASWAIATLQADARIGRSEALRRSMIALIEQGGRDAHPAVWAPFVVVGGGASMRAGAGARG